VENFERWSARRGSGVTEVRDTRQLAVRKRVARIKRWDDVVEMIAAAYGMPADKYLDVQSSRLHVLHGWRALRLDLKYVHLPAGILERLERFFDEGAARG
jgi:hypothetical protein